MYAGFWSSTQFKRAVPNARETLVTNVKSDADLQKELTEVLVDNHRELMQLLKDVNGMS